MQPVRTHRFGGLLRQRDFRLFWVGASVSEVGNALAVVAMPLLVVTVLDADVFTVGLLTAFAFLPWLLISLPAGAWIDRLPPRRVMVVSDLASGISYASIPVAAWLDILTIEYVLAIALSAGIANVFFDTAYQVELANIVAKPDLVEGNTKLQASVSFSRLGGSSLGGLVVQAIGAASALLVNALSFFVSMACLLRLEHPGRAGNENPTRKPDVLRSIAEGARFVVQDPYFRPLTIWAAVSNFGLTGHDALIVVFLVRDVGLGPELIGVLMAAGGIGAVAGTLVAGRLVRRFGTSRGLLVCSTFIIPFVMLIPLTDPGTGLGFYVAGIMLCVIGIAITNVIVASFRQSYSPEGMLGRITATTRFLLNGSYPVGALAAGALGTWIGTRGALWIMLGFVAFAGVLLLTPTFLRRRDLPGQDPAMAPARDIGE
ncbi:MFS transporter [Nonomuraea maritima]|uniref:MFS transporter n=1 Tax=Nonomuraea maritima TaxID=683260 RepID=UPI000B884C3A|nr:MFS transporter [Nonomuraea maritima]